MKKKVEEEKLSLDETIKRFNRTSKVLAICCILLLLMGCFYNGIMVISNCKEQSFDLLISIFVSLIFTFMGSFGLGYYFSFKVLKNTDYKKDKK